MTRGELLAVQQRVIHAITGEAAISGIDPLRIELQRGLATAKRIEKVQSVLPRTCRALGEELPRLAAEFMQANPPRSFRSRADGLMFYRFLRSQRVAPQLTELAYVELAIAAIGARPVRLHTCRFDVRASFEDESASPPATVPPEPVRLAIFADPGTGPPRIIQVPPATFQFLRAYQMSRGLPDVADEATRRLLDELREHGLLELPRRGRRRDSTSAE